jgi:hypothetical protein
MNLIKLSSNLGQGSRTLLPLGKASFNFVRNR